MLITGSPDTVHQTDISVRGRTVPEDRFSVEYYEDYLVGWVDKDYSLDVIALGILRDTNNATILVPDYRRSGKSANGIKGAFLPNRVTIIPYGQPRAPWTRL